MRKLGRTSSIGGVCQHYKRIQSGRGASQCSPFHQTRSSKPRWARLRTVRTGERTSNAPSRIVRPGKGREENQTQAANPSAPMHVMIAYIRCTAAGASTAGDYAVCDAKAKIRARHANEIRSLGEDLPNRSEWYKGRPENETK